MNDKRLIKEIASAFEVPAPVRKDKFLYEHGLKTPKDRLNLILSQIRYIHKSVWILSILVLVLSVLILSKDARAALRFSSLVMPFVAGIGVFATMRSRMYGMSELEASTVMSLRGSIFTRFTIISLSHLLLMAVLSLVMGTGSAGTFLVTCCHIVAPYLLTSVLCMEIERTKTGRGNRYFCFAVSFMISVIVYLAQSYIWPLIAGAAGAAIAASTALLIIANVREYIIIYRMEEKKWNFV